MHRRSFFDRIGRQADSIQFAGAGTANNISIKFNTYVHRMATNSNPTSFVDLETQIDAGATMSNPEIVQRRIEHRGGEHLLPSTARLGAIKNA